MKVEYHAPNPDDGFITIRMSVGQAHQLAQEMQALIGKDVFGSGVAALTKDIQEALDFPWTIGSDE